jgi:protein SCO1/2
VSDDASNAGLQPVAARTRRYGGKHVLLIMLAIVIVAAIPAVVVPILSRRHPPKLDDLGTIAAFQLTDDRGQSFTDASMRGHPTIVSFIFTRCDTICPVTTMTMEQLQNKTFDEPIDLLSISVDPTYDTPARLAEYAKRYHADAERWRFITGPADRIHDLVVGSFMTSMQRQADRPGGIPDIAHGGYFMLVDGDLHIRGRYSSSQTIELDKLIRDARYLARTQK